jgi:hypothetical protein
MGGAQPIIPTDEQVQDAVDAYMDAHPGALVVDPELSDTSTHAIQNKAVTEEFTKVNGRLSDLKEDLNATTGLSSIHVITGKYIGQSSGKVNPNPTNNASWMYALIPCVEGQRITVNGVSGGSPRAWVFVDASYNVLSTADVNAAYTHYEITAPADTAYLVINNLISDGRLSYLGWAEFGYAEDTEQLLAWETQAKADMGLLKVSADESASILKTGQGYIDTEWTQGVASTSATGVTAQTYSYCTAGIVSFDHEITITIADGFQAFLRYFTDDEYISTGNWFHTSLAIPANQQFRLTVKKYPDDTSVVADITFKQGATIESKLERRLEVLENSGTLNTQWNGKQWFAFGCSLSDNSTAMPFPSYTGEVTGKYPSYLCALSGLIHTNYAKGGSTISDAEHTNADGRHPTAIQKLQEAITAGTIVNADLITLEGCVNDWSHATPLGDFTDTTDVTICGSMYLFLTTAMNANPNATIVVIGDSTGKAYTRPDSVTVDLSYNRKNTIQLYQSQYVQKMKEYCEFMGVIFIDAGQDSEINSLHPQYLGDFIHHSDEGGEQFANAIWARLKNIQPNVT